MCLFPLSSVGALGEDSFFRVLIVSAEAFWNVPLRNALLLDFVRKCYIFLQSTLVFAMGTCNGLSLAVRTRRSECKSM